MWFVSPNLESHVTYYVNQYHKREPPGSEIYPNSYQPSPNFLQTVLPDSYTNRGPHYVIDVNPW